MFLLFIVLFVASGASEQPCLDFQSVDISGVQSSENGTIIKDGVVFPPKYVYSKQVSGEIRTFGCLCQARDCFRKCCPIGSVFYGTNCTEMPDMDVLSNGPLDLFFASHLRKKMKVASNFDLLFGKPCKGMFVEDSKWYVQEDGNLYVEIPSNIPPVFIYGPDKYCIDTFVSENHETYLNALICFLTSVENHSKYKVSSSCMLISCFFILLTVAVYAWLPELRNLHGKVLMAYLLSFFVSFLFLATMQILILTNQITQTLCTVLTFIVYFSLLAAFFWLNVMCYDIWWTFSGKRAHGRSGSANKRFGWYCLYAFSVPTVLTIILGALEFSNLPMQHPLMPKLRLQGCFLYGNSKLLYLYGPIVILCIANMIFFTLTALKIAKIKKETKMLHTKDSSTTDQDNKDQQRFGLYLKLFTVMGINWILEVISSFYPKADFFWQFPDAYNVLVGLIIFIIFVCKRKTLNMIKKRYRQVRGLEMSRSQTTTSASTRTLSSRDELHMNSIKK